MRKGERWSRVLSKAWRWQASAAKGGSSTEPSAVGMAGVEGGGGTAEGKGRLVAFLLVEEDGEAIE